SSSVLPATPSTASRTLSLHAALPICDRGLDSDRRQRMRRLSAIARRWTRNRWRASADSSAGVIGPKRSHSCWPLLWATLASTVRSEEHTSELQSRENLVCRLLLAKTQ